MKKYISITPQQAEAEIMTHLEDRENSKVYAKIHKYASHVTDLFPRVKWVNSANGYFEIITEDGEYKGLLYGVKTFFKLQQ